jgi:hypothetical protein
VPLDAQIDTVDAAQLARLDQAAAMRKVDGDARS